MNSIQRWRLSCSQDAVNLSLEPLSLCHLQVTLGTDEYMENTDLTRKKGVPTKVGHSSRRSLLVRLACELLCPYNKLQGIFSLRLFRLDAGLKNTTSGDDSCKLFCWSCCSFHDLPVQITVFANMLCISYNMDI